jgi:hypothetical protein
MRFRAIDRFAGKTATGFSVPPEVVEGFGEGKRPAVRVTINGYTYRSTIAPTGGEFLLGVSAENRVPSHFSGAPTVLALHTGPVFVRGTADRCVPLSVARSFGGQGRAGASVF